MARLIKELKNLTVSPPTGVTCWAEADGGGANSKILGATIFPDEGSSYKGGTFKLEIEIPHRYPFNPPKVRFLTKIYHPNIDTAGRICLDILKMPPSGAWKPAHNISSILTSIRFLISAPNPDDPLMADIAEEYKVNRASFEATAQAWTKKYAMEPNATQTEMKEIPSNLSEESRKRKFGSLSE